MTHPLLTSHPNGVFPVLEVAKAIGQEATNLRRKAAAMNGQVNFNAESDTLNVHQLTAILPTYLNGRGQLKGGKRKSVESLLKAIGSPVETIGTPERKPVERKKEPAAKPVATLREKLEILGFAITYFVGSVPFTYAYYFAFIFAEAAIQADLLHKATNLHFMLLLPGTLGTLGLLVLLTINSKFDETRIFQRSVYVTGQGWVQKGIDVTTAAELTLFVYNALMCEARFFYNGLSDNWLINGVLFFAGLAIPAVILISSRILKNRIAKMKF